MNDAWLVLHFDLLRGKFLLTAWLEGLADGYLGKDPLLGLEKTSERKLLLQILRSKICSLVAGVESLAKDLVRSLAGVNQGFEDKV